MEVADQHEEDDNWLETDVPIQMRECTTYSWQPVGLPVTMRTILIKSELACLNKAIESL